MKAPAKKGKGKAMAAPAPGPAHAMMAHDDMKYRAQDALHTLKRAHEIKSDAALMHHVKQHAKQERNTLAKVIRRKT